VLEWLEDRTCPSALYHYNVIAQTGTAGLTSIVPGASINDAGKVAFVGSLGGTQGVFVGDGTALTNIDSAFIDPTRFLGGELQINNTDDVAVGERLVGDTVITAVRVWHADTPNTFTTIAAGSNPPLDSTYFNGVGNFMSITDDGKVAFAGLDDTGWNIYQSAAQVNPGDTDTLVTSLPRSAFFRQMSAAGNKVVIGARTGSTKQVVLYDLSTSPKTTTTIATTAAGDWADLGVRPGISPDGKVVAFYGDLTAAGAAAINAAQVPNGYTALTPGPGIFVSDGKVYGRVTGAGYGGPSDVNTFDVDTRVVIATNLVSNGLDVVFMGQDSSGNDGIYRTSVLQTKSLRAGFDQLVAQVGDSIAGLPGTIQSLAMSFALNEYGQVAFWVNMGGGVNAVAVAEPGYTPAQVRTAYGINSLALDGTGQTIAIVNQYNDPPIFADLDTFDKQFGITTAGKSLYDQYGPASSFLTVYDETGKVIDPATTTSPPSDSFGTDAWETAIDVEWAHAIAPGAKIDLIEVSPERGEVAWPDKPRMLGAKLAATLDGVSVVSMSWGSDFEDSTELAGDSYFVAPAGHQGVTFIAASGDKGGDQFGYPAASPNVVGVGGTYLYPNTDSSYHDEIGWKGSGGGTSQYESQPAYQAGVVPGSMSNYRGETNRTVPDVSFDAPLLTGGALYDSYRPNPTGTPHPWWLAGGTSWGAPCWAGLIALANQGRVAAGKKALNSSGPTQTLAALYSLPAGDFHDITKGNNGFAAGPGYDLVTGRGSPIANLLVPDLIAASTMTFTPASVPDSTVGVAYNQTITASGGTGTTTVSYTVTSGSIPAGLSFTPSANQLLLTGTPTADGTVAFDVKATDAASDTATQSYTLTINKAISFSPGALPNGTVSAAYGQTITANDGTGPKTVTYAVTSGSIPAGLSFTTSTNQLLIAGAPTGSGSVTFDVGATDTVGATASKSYTLTITPAFVPPVVTAVGPGSGPGGGGNTVTITGTGFTGTTAVAFGGAAAASFTVVSSTTITAVAPPEVAGAVDVTVTNPAGTSGIVPADRYTFLAPGVTGVSSTTPSGTYGTGATVTITVAFSEPVTVTGKPTLALNTGAIAAYSGGSGGSTLTFAYVIRAGDHSGRLDYASPRALSLAGASIKDAGNNAAVLTLPAPGAPGSLGASKNIVIDAIAPRVLSYSVLFGSKSYNLIGSTRYDLPWQVTGVRVVFNKPITSGDLSSLAGLPATGLSGLGTNTLTWTVSPVSRGSFNTLLPGSGGHALRDAAGNGLAGGAGFSQSFRVLWGDVDGDGALTAADVLVAMRAAHRPYNVFADVNGDGAANDTDADLVLLLVGGGKLKSCPKLTLIG
jgi:hypothetical protein